jgi:CRP/FNR family transcriptional regulator, cyclic AMP receptor protein
MPTTSVTSRKTESGRLNSRELAAISAPAVTRSFPAGTVVLSEGDATNSLYVVLSGRVKIFLADPTGREIVLGHTGPGEYFGEMTLDGGPRSASVVTEEVTRLSIIPQADFKHFIAANPDFAFHLVKKLISRVRSLTDNVKSLALMDVYGRVARVLLELAHEENGQLVVTEKPTQQDIAARIGASREMVSRILKELGAGGYLRIDGKRLIIAQSLPQGW